MPEAVKYERIESAETDVNLSELNAESSHDSTPDSPSTRIDMPIKQHVRLSVARTTAATLILILFYFCLSIGLTFYQRWLLKVIYILWGFLCLPTKCRGESESRSLYLIYRRTILNDKPVFVLVSASGDCICGCVGHN